MARNSGCADEAWDLVMEFVASETDHDAQSDTCLSCFDAGDSTLAFETPAEAMIQCLGNDAGALRESASEFPELGLSSEPDDWTTDSVPAMLDPEAVMPPAMATEGFSHDLLNLLEQLLAEALTGDAEAEDPELDDPITLAGNRRTSH
jgi:hypothetical protein